jgi:hypothetical protein
MVFRRFLAGSTGQNAPGPNGSLGNMSAAYSPSGFFQRYRIQAIGRWPRGQRQRAAWQAAQAALLRDLVYEGMAASTGGPGK